MEAPEGMIRRNTSSQSFELKTDGKRSFMNYAQSDDHTLALTHTEVDPALEGKGIGSKLVQQVLEYADEHKLKIVPLCPFVATYIKRHPDWQRVVSAEYDQNDF